MTVTGNLPGTDDRENGTRYRLTCAVSRNCSYNIVLMYATADTAAGTALQAYVGHYRAADRLMTVHRQRRRSYRVCRSCPPLDFDAAGVELSHYRYAWITDTKTGMDEGVPEKRPGPGRGADILCLPSFHLKTTITIL
jgi:hypothetical protein